MTPQIPQTLIDAKYRAYIEHPRSIFFYSCLSFFLWVSLGENMEGIFLIGLFSLFFVSLWGLLGSKKNLAFSMAFLLFGYGYAFWSMGYHIEREAYIATITWNYTRSIQIKWRIDDTVSTDDRYSRYRLRIDTIDNTSPPTSTHILVRIPRNLTIKVGDTLFWKWKIQSVSAASENGYHKYSLLHQTYGSANIYTFERHPSEESLFFENIRNSLFVTIERLFPGDTAWLLSGILIGNTDGISDATKQAFQTSWLSHILAVSGSNVTFLLIILEKLIRYLRLSRGIRIGIISSLLLVFMILAGFDVPVIRATAMWLLVYWWFTFDTKLESMSLLMLIMIGFVLYEPLYLMNDVGFMLSCLATGSILSMKRWIEKWVQWIPDFLALRESAIISIAATLWTTPYLLSVFGVIPVYSILANIALWPIVGWIMFFGIVTLGVSYISSIGAYLLGYIPYIAIVYVMKVADFFASITPVWTMDSSLLQHIILVVWCIFVVVNILEFIWIRLSQTQTAYSRQLYLRNQDKTLDQ